MNAANIRAETGSVGVFGDRDQDFDIVGGGATLELRSCLQKLEVST